jgi:hypothetical protein
VCEKGFSRRGFPVTGERSASLDRPHVSSGGYWPRIFERGDQARIMFTGAQEIKSIP